MGVAEDPASKASVLAALTRKFDLGPDVDLQSLAQQCAVTLTGADLYALASDAWMTALKRTVVSDLAEGRVKGTERSECYRLLFNCHASTIACVSLPECRTCTGNHRRPAAMQHVWHGSPYMQLHAHVFGTWITSSLHMQVEEGDSARAVTVHHGDFQASLGQLVPSLSPQELQRYRVLQQQFQPAA